MVSSTPALPPCCTRSSSKRDEAVAALEREALLTHVLGVQIALQPFGGGQLPQNVLLLIGAEAALHARDLETVLQPQPLVGVRHVRKFRADGVGVNELQVARGCS